METTGGFGTGGLGRGLDGGLMTKTTSEMKGKELEPKKVQEEIADVECPNCNKKFTN